MTDPSARDKRRPFELIGLAAIVAVFVGASPSRALGSGAALDRAPGATQASLGP